MHAVPPSLAVPAIPQPLHLWQKLAPLALIFFCATFNHTLLTNLKASHRLTCSTQSPQCPCHPCLQLRISTDIPELHQLGKNEITHILLNTHLPANACRTPLW